MPAKSKAQRRFFGMCEHADHSPANCPDMSKSQMHDFAATPEKDLPYRVTKEQDQAFRDGFKRK